MLAAEADAMETRLLDSHVCVAMTIACLLYSYVSFLFLQGVIVDVCCELVLNGLSM